MKYPVVILAVCTLSAQSLRVYSEFAQIDSTGEPVAPPQPREILSPAIARNAFTSYQVVVQVDKGTHYWLHIGQNPEEAVRTTLYRQTGGLLIPAELTFEGWDTQLFWLDIWTDGRAPVRRIKIEPQLFVDNEWIVYPMEARVVETTVPDGPLHEGSAAPVDVMRSFTCGTKLVEPAPKEELSAERLRFRNAQQDLALASRAPKEDLRALLGGCALPPPEQPEWYLRIRDYLLRMR